MHRISSAHLPTFGNCPNFGAMSANIVTFRDVRKKYKWFQALDGVDLELRTGEIFGFIGPNGAGKTTTLKLICGLLRNFEGEIEVSGLKLPEGYGEVHHFTGFLPQSPGFQNWRTVEDALLSRGLLSGVPRPALEQRITELLQRFDMVEARKKKIKALSGGMLQKIGFAQALLHRPKLVVLDEPLNNLDPSARGEVKQIIRELKDEGVTIIFSSHILSDVEDVADRIGIIQKGKMQFTGTTMELKRHFGVPNDIHLEFSTQPDNVDYLQAVPGLESLKAPGLGKFVLRFPPSLDIDPVVHTIITQTLEAGGRIRTIGQFTPSLDELYVRYFETQKQKGAQP